MAYFLKRSNIKNGTYLQIYESFYNPIKKATSHHSVMKIGYVKDLVQAGIEDPITYYKDEVKRMNEKAKLKKEEDSIKMIEVSPEKNLGYFPIKNIYDGLNVAKYLDILQSTRDFDFSLNEVTESLIYARCINPCSKHKSFHDVIPTLFGNYSFSYDQLLSGLTFLGTEYEKVVEIFTKRYKERYGSETSKTYFDCTNFFFEIDREDDWRKKGPSKENQKSPIIGLGLLLDADQVPIAMKMYPGNESEKPVLREIIKDLKNQNNVQGRTIQIADKGLNCAANIASALKNKDGYLFSKSVKTLNQVEKKWVLLDNDYKNVMDKTGELLYKYKSTVDTFQYEYIDENNLKHKLNIKEKRVVTFNQKLKDKKMYEINKMVEKAKKLNYAKAKKEEYGESSRYVTFSSTDEKGNTTTNKVAHTMNEEAIAKDIELAGYNLLVTSEIGMNDEEIYDAYHGLWRIEESFRIMKSELDARPVFMRTTESIMGHFLICYLSVFLIRILEFKVLKNKYSSSQIIDFIRKYRVIKDDKKSYINISSKSDIITGLAKEFSLPLCNFHLEEKQIKKILNHVI